MKISNFYQRRRTSLLTLNWTYEDWSALWRVIVVYAKVWPNLHICWAMRFKKRVLHLRLKDGKRTPRITSKPRPRLAESAVLTWCRGRRISCSQVDTRARYKKCRKCWRPKRKTDRSCLFDNSSWEKSFSSKEFSVLFLFVHDAPWRNALLHADNF